MNRPKARPTLKRSSRSLGGDPPPRLSDGPIEAAYTPTDRYTVGDAVARGGLGYMARWLSQARRYMQKIHRAITMGACYGYSQRRWWEWIKAKLSIAPDPDAPQERDQPLRLPFQLRSQMRNPIDLGAPTKRAAQ